jgi:hypothetical protein
VAVDSAIVIATIEIASQKTKSKPNSMAAAVAAAVP